MPFIDEAVTITVSGSWPDGCPPEYGSHEVTDGVVQIVTQREEAEICPTVITPWSLDVVLDPLPSGPYSIRVAGVVNTESALLVASQRTFLAFLTQQTTTSEPTER